VAVPELLKKPLHTYSGTAVNSRHWNVFSVLITLPFFYFLRSDNPNHPSLTNPDSDQFYKEREERLRANHSEEIQDWEARVNKLQGYFIQVKIKITF